MRPRGRTVEREIALIAGQAQGVATRRELIAAGITPAEIARRVRSGALLREHRGVYRVGHRAPSVEARYVAAVRAGGDGALLSGLAAAHLHGLLGGPPPVPEVTAPTERRIPGVSTHRCRRMDPRDATIVRSVPATTVPRTLVDIAGSLLDDDLARACHEAIVRYRLAPAQVEAVLARRPKAPGAGRLRAVLRGDVRVTLSALERRFLALLRQAGLPLPETNRRVGAHRVDCRWPDPRLTVELDSYRYHGSRHAWEQDRRRDRATRVRGDEPRRYTYADVYEDPGFMLAELRDLLAVKRPA